MHLWRLAPARRTLHTYRLYRRDPVSLSSLQFVPSTKAKLRPPMVPAPAREPLPDLDFHCPHGYSVSWDTEYF